MFRSLDMVATNVAIVTTADASGVHGCTANAWAESGNPDILLVTLRRGGATLARLLETRQFGVSVLGASQLDVATRFVGPRHERFSDVRLRHEENTVPLIGGALANFECAVEDVYAFGLYDIVVGSIVRDWLSPGEDEAALVHFAGSFVQTASLGSRQW